MSLAPDPSSSSTASASSQSASFAQASEGDSNPPRLDTINSGIGPSQLEPESIALGVVNEPEEEEDMNDLRPGFMERHRKRLYEMIDIVSFPAKRPCPEKA